MVKTADKIILGVLVVFLAGMSGVFISAIPSNGNENPVSPNTRLLVADTAFENTNVELETDLEEDEKEFAITGSALEKASAVALAHIGEGRVTDSEVGDEESYYEIEITLNNGNEVDVQLDENFKVLSTEYEDEEDD